MIDSTYVTEHYDMYDYHDTEGDGYEDEYNECEDYDSDWIDMSDIPEDMTFEEPELACILENLQKGRKGSGKYHRKGRKGFGKVEFRDKKGFGKGEFGDKKGFGKGEFRDKEGGKGNRSENYKQVRLKLQGDRLNRGWRDQPTRPSYKGRYGPQFVHVDDLLTRTRCYKCGESGHHARNCSQKKEDDPSLFSGDKETATESETFFSGMTLGELNVETVLVKQEDLFLHDSNIDEPGDINVKTVCAEQEELFLHGLNIDEPGDINVKTVCAEQEELFLHGLNIDELGDLNDEAVFVEQEELFLHDSNIDELGDLNNEAVFTEQEEMFFTGFKH